MYDGVGVGEGRWKEGGHQMKYQHLLIYIENNYKIFHLQISCSNITNINKKT
jgi:hypothetical protein